MELDAGPSASNDAPQVVSGENAIVATVSSVPAAFAANYNDNAGSFDVGDMSERCEHCDASMFSGERVNGHFSLCCSNGKVVLPQEHMLKPVPIEIKSLMTSNSKEAVNLAWQHQELQFCTRFCISYGSNRQHRFRRRHICLQDSR